MRLKVTFIDNFYSPLRGKKLNYEFCPVVGVSSKHTCESNKPTLLSQMCLVKTPTTGQRINQFEKIYSFI